MENNLKENSIGQTVYEQLQEILNKCMKLGWRPRGQGRWGYEKGYCDEDGMYISYGVCISYHDLFSKDSGLMEFVKWKDNENEYALNVKLYDNGLDCECSWSGGSYDKKTRIGYHYMTMGDMTAEQKIQYFLENAIIPTPLSE